MLGAQGKPLSAYPGWDADAGVFRLDASFREFEERYRRMADEADAESVSPPPAEPDAEASKPPAHPARG